MAVEQPLEALERGREDLSRRIPFRAGLELPGRRPAEGRQQDRTVLAEPLVPGLVDQAVDHHVAADHRLLLRGLPLERHAEQLPNPAAATVAAHQVLRLDLPPAGEGDEQAGIGLREAGQLGSPLDPHAVVSEPRAEYLLRPPLRHEHRAVPEGVGLLDQLTLEVLAEGETGDPGGADPVAHTEGVEHLEAAGVECLAPRPLLALSGLVDDPDGDTSPREFTSEGQSGGAGTHDQHGGHASSSRSAAASAVQQNTTELRTQLGYV